jgi:hypothetical protein
MITSLAELAADARAVAEEYLAVTSAGLAAEFRDQVVDDLRAFLCDHLSPASTVAEVRSLAARAGTPEAGEPGPARSWRRIAAGFDPRNVATRVATTWWNPADGRLFVPRAIGWGFDLNFGALAVRLGLIEPDAEAEPFTSTPDSAFLAAAAVPAALAAATVVHYAVRGAGLPDRLPSHWDIAGAPDRWVGKQRAAATDLATTVLPAVLAVAAARSARPGPQRAGVLAGASAVAAAGATITVLRSLGDRPRPWTGPATVVAIFGAAGSVLFGLARAGRAAEIRGDLSRGRA